MSLHELLKKDLLKPHATSLKEIENLRMVVGREFADAAITQVSTDRRFACYYNAGLQLGQMVLACAGYRVNTSKGGHHATTFEAVEQIIGPTSSALATYFDVCRRKRNKVDYDVASLVTDKELQEIAIRAREFETLVEDWIANNHPAYKKP